LEAFSTEWRPEGKKKLRFEQDPKTVSLFRNRYEFASRITGEKTF